MVAVVAGVAGGCWRYTEKATKVWQHQVGFGVRIEVSIYMEMMCICGVHHGRPQKFSLFRYDTKHRYSHVNRLWQLQATPSA